MTIFFKYLRPVLLPLLLLATVQTAYAIDERYAAAPLRGNQIRKDSSNLVQDTVYFNPTLKPLQTAYTVRNLITFKIDEFANLVIPDLFEIQVDFKVYYKRDQSGTTVSDSTALISLKIKYDKNGSYDFKAIHTFLGGHEAQVVIKQVTVLQGTLSAFENVLMLENEILVLREYDFDCTNNAVTTVNSSTSYVNTKGELQVSWAPELAADEYDLEWTWVDSAAQANYKTSGQFDPKKIFTRNATRVSIAGTQYFIPLLYDGKGYLFYRVRAVQVKPNGQRMESSWSSDFQNGWGSYEFTGHENALNWQVSTSFAEEGKRKSVVQYFDGSLRNRQAVAKDNTTDTTIVGETLYDYQGRPVIQVMPTPSLSSLIKYTPNFNRALNAAGYEKDLYDGDWEDSCYCTTGAPPMDSLYGASNYYSPANPLSGTRHHSYIPDAEKYPFSEVRFTSDKTGRVSLQGGVGRKFQIGMKEPGDFNHETKFIYSSADQEELDALFGTEAGNYKHYSKNMVRDANGQYSISYVDMHGRTVATALAGKPRANMDTLVSNRTQVIVKKLLDSNTNLIKGTTIESSKGLVVTKAGNHTFHYSLMPDSVNIEDCDQVDICYDCIYDLEITITDECNNTSLPGDTALVIKRGNFSLDTNCNANVAFPSVDHTVFLEEGAYLVTKKLTISQQAMDYYRDSIFMRRNTCVSLDSFIREQKNILDLTLQCALTCEECGAVMLGDFETFYPQWLSDMGYPPDNGDFLYYTDALDAYEEMINSCEDICDEPSQFKMTQSLMLDDVTPPFGQYANPDNITAYSIFWNDKYKTATWVDNHSRPIVANLPDGNIVSPAELTREEFIANWQPSWASVLLPLHPEYCFYLRANELNEHGFYHWEDRFLKVKTFDEAVTNGFLNPGNFSIRPGGAIFTPPGNDYDYFFYDVNFIATGLKTEMNDSLARKKYGPNAADTISLWALATIMAHCPEGDNSCFTAYRYMNTAFNIPDSCSGDLDMAWLYFQQLYLQERREILYKWIRLDPDCYHTIDEEEFFVHFPDPSELGTGFPQNESDGTDSLNKFIADNCASYVKLWWEELKPCNYNTTDTAWIFPRLREVCRQGGDETHVFGSSTVKPSSTYQYRSFEEVLKAYDPARYGASCNAYLISVPIAYEQRPVYSEKPIYQKPDSCECGKINSYYTQYQQYGQADTSFGAFLYRITGVRIYDGVLDTLRMACNDEVDCRFLKESLLLPAVLQCGSENACVGCTQVNLVYKDYIKEFTEDAEPDYDDTDSTQRLMNRLFRNYMNSRLGFSLSHTDYLTFMDSCSISTDSTDLFEPLDTATVTCGQLYDLIKEFYYLYFNPVSHTTDLQMITFAGNNTPLEGPKGVFDVNGQLIGNTVDGTTGAIDTSYAAIWNSSAANKIVGQITPLGNGKFRLFLNPGQQVPCGGLIGQRYYQFETHVNDTLRSVGTTLGSYVDWGDSTHFFPVHTGNYGADIVTRFDNDGAFFHYTKTLGADFPMSPQITLRHVYPYTSSRTTYTATVYHADTLGRVRFEEFLVDTAAAQFTNLRGYFPQHLLSLVFDGTRDSTFNRTREIRNWDQISSIVHVQFRFSGSPAGTPAPMKQNNFGSFANNHGLRAIRLEPTYSLIPNYQTPGVLDAVAGKHIYENFPDWKNNFPDLRVCIIGGFEGRLQDMFQFNFELPQLKVMNTFGDVPTGFTDTFYNQVARATIIDSGIAIVGAALATNPDPPTAASSAARNYLLSQTWWLNHVGLAMGTYSLGVHDNFAQDTALPFIHPFTAYANQRLGTSFNWKQLKAFYDTKCDTVIDFCQNAPPDTPLLCGNNEPAFPFVFLKQRSSCDDSTLFAVTTATLRYEAYHDSLLNVFNERYIAKCLNARYAENFTVEQPTSEYHYTLYYYDQAGNLVKTVPPQGVDMSKFGWILNWSDSVKTARANKQWLGPDHGLETDYRYNTLDQVVAQKSPDGGLSEFWYDRLGRLAISRNARQKVAGSSNDDNRLYSYTRYDMLGRITEVGQASNTSANGTMTDAISRNQTSLDSWLLSLAGRMGQITRTVYDLPYDGFSGVADLRLIVQQRNLRNRVSFVSISDTSTTAAFNQATFYTYDILGNVDTLLQDYGLSGSVPNLMNMNGNRWKKITYRYDLISGKVNMVMYQRGWGDQFFHRYTYDAENRLILAETSLDSLVWERDARYEYYRHGPLARTTLGEQMVQGMDYAYTLQGWLKGINSTGGTITHDIGGDGKSAGINQYTARDALGLTLNYFADEFKPINGSVTPFPPLSNATYQSTGYRPLFNGNISSISVYNRKFESGVAGGAMVFYNYKYDQLNRLTAMDAWTGFNSGTNSWGSMSISDMMQERVAYDANGNITKYLRNGITASPITMDSLNYKYYANTNQLRQVTDNVPSGRYGSVPWDLDIDGQANADNYVYDQIGNLIEDKAEQITNIKWSAYGKILEITRTSTGMVPITSIRYTYDALGNRISKVFDLNGTKQYTWYVCDAQGNLLSTYTSSGNDSPLSSLGLSQSEKMLYGSSRLGIYAFGIGVDGGPSDLQYYNTGTFVRGFRQYELTNHLGNVLVMLSDKKLGVTSGSSLLYYEPHMLSGNDYYPFGMVSRIALTSAGTHYRFGFNGKEFDWEAKGWQNQIDYGMRVYDPRIGKFLSVDPLTKDFPALTPYQYASNTPVSSIDIDGLESSKKFNVIDWGIEFAKGLWEGITGDDLDNDPSFGNLTSIGMVPQFYRSDITSQIMDAQRLVTQQIKEKGTTGFVQDLGAKMGEGWKGFTGKIADGDPRTLGGVIGELGSLAAPYLSQTKLKMPRFSLSVRRRNAGSGFSLNAGNADASDFGLGDINKVGGTLNCVNCSMATDYYLKGVNVQATDFKKTLNVRFLEEQYGTTFNRNLNIDQVKSMVSKPGDIGIVFGTREGQPGHVFNVINDKGTIKFLDGQTGKPAVLTGYKNFWFLPTK
jgi:RHS repeat-associated protein